MTCDASSGKETLAYTNSYISPASKSNYYNSAPLFIIANTGSVINLNGCTLNYGISVFISSKGTTADGNERAKGGTVPTIKLGES